MSCIRRVTALASVLFVLSACGGGGSGSGDSGTPPPPPPTYSVNTSVAGNGSGSISPDSRTVSQGGTTSLTITPAVGSTIASVAGCGGSLSGITYTTGPITGSCTVSATFELNTYTVTAAAGGGGSISPASSILTHGSTTTFMLSPAEGYSVAAVTGCGGSLNGNAYTTGVITGACNVSASFALTRYAVSTDPGQGGRIDPANVLVEHGSSTVFTLVALEGYSITDATGCGGSLNGNTFTTGPITAACTVSGAFTINRYEVSAIAGPGGTISPQSIEIEHGSTASFEVQPDPGYRIDAVFGCDGSLEASRFTTGPVSGPCTVEALFRLPSVSGTVFPAAATAADSDVNDPFAPYASNNSFPVAQLVGNPVTIGGYVNTPFRGPEGRSYFSGDAVDIFQVNLDAGQEVRLVIASQDVSDDLDLWLVDLEGFVIDASLDASAREESVIAPSDAAGEYYVVVEASDGASNYVLVVDEAAPAAPATMRLSDNFVPGEVIIRLVDEVPAGEGALLAHVGALGSGRGRDPNAPQRNKLVRLDELHSVGTGVSAIARVSDAHRLPGESREWSRARDSVTLSKLETLAMVKALARDRSVAAVTPNYLHELHQQAMPDDPEFPKQWHYAQISVPEAWSLATGAEVIVAVIDSGVLLAHPDLSDQLVEGYDFVLNLPGGDDPGYDPVPPGGSTFHGTHVAGTIAAATYNGIGVAGVAFDARIMPLRACNANGCSGYAIEQALRYASGLINDSGVIPPQPARVINLSLGRQGGPALIQEQLLFDQLRELDIFVVASAGNSGTDVESYPAAYGNVIAVSAVDFAGEPAYYSNFGAWIDVAAPGGDARRDLNGDGFPDGVLSTWADDSEGPPQPDYRFSQGTSMAAPHVAGVAALMRSVAPALHADDIENLLRNRAITDDLGTPGRDDIYGWGLINAAKAVTEALNTGGQPVPLAPYMVASALATSFGATLQSRGIVFSNQGGGELAFGIPTEDSGGWLNLAAEEVAGELFLTLLADRAGLAEGQYVATVTMPSNANTVEVAAILQVRTFPGAQVGLQYVLLLDPESMGTMNWALAELAPDGSQPFTIENVAPGNYLLISGSDSNHDFVVCDAGESCGHFQDGPEPLPIQVLDQDINGLEFTSGYSVPGTAGESIRRLDGAWFSRR